MLFAAVPARRTPSGNAPVDGLPIRRRDFGGVDSLRLYRLDEARNEPATPWRADVQQKSRARRDTDDPLTAFTWLDRLQYRELPARIAVLVRLRPDPAKHTPRSEHGHSLAMIDVANLDRLTEAQIDVHTTRNEDQ